MSSSPGEMARVLASRGDIQRAIATKSQTPPGPPSIDAQERLASIYAGQQDSDRPSCDL